MKAEDTNFEMTHEEEEVEVENDEVDGAHVSFTESEQSVLRRKLFDYFSNKGRRTSLSDALRLVGVLVIAFASIVCIALDKERIYFTNVLTFIVGVIVDSPLGGGGGGRGGGGGGEGLAHASTSSPQSPSVTGPPSP